MKQSLVDALIHSGGLGESCQLRGAGLDFDQTLAFVRASNGDMNRTTPRADTPRNGGRPLCQ